MEKIGNGVDVTNLPETALIELISDNILMDVISGCGFNSLTVLKREFIFTPKQFITFQNWLRS